MKIDDEIWMTRCNLYCEACHVDDVTIIVNVLILFFILFVFVLFILLFIDFFSCVIMSFNKILDVVFLAFLTDITTRVFKWIISIALLANRSESTLSIFIVIIVSIIVFIIVNSSDIELSFAIDVHLCLFLFESLENSFFDKRLVVNNISHFIIRIVIYDLFAKLKLFNILIFKWFSMMISWFLNCFFSW